MPLPQLLWGYARIREVDASQPFPMAVESMIEETEVVVVGAGPAGLAVGACLHELGIPFVILEREESIASSWRQHYERLHLHTDKARSALPFHQFPSHYPRYPARQQMIDYLASYARRFGLQPRLGQEVLSVRRVGDPSSSSGYRWESRTTDTTLLSRHTVIASGLNSVPHTPPLPGLEEFQGSVTHSAQYRNGAPYEGQRVLVVGFGNSGAEIAIDLHEYGARPLVSLRGEVNVIPRELFGLPILAVVIPLSRLPGRLADTLTRPILRFIYGDLRRLGLRTPNYGPFVQVANRGRIPVIDVGTLDLVERGEVAVRGPIGRFHQNKVQFDDGQVEEVDSVILATGYRPGYPRFLDTAEQLHPDGTSPEGEYSYGRTPGLHLCGFHVVATGMLREIAREAQRIVTDISSSGVRQVERTS